MAEPMSLSGLVSSPSGKHHRHRLRSKSRIRDDVYATASESSSSPRRQPQGSRPAATSTTEIRDNNGDICTVIIIRSAHGRFHRVGVRRGRTQNVYVPDEHGGAPLLASKAHEGRFVVLPANNVCSNDDVAQHRATIDPPASLDLMEDEAADLSPLHGYLAW